MLDHRQRDNIEFLLMDRYFAYNYDDSFIGYKFGNDSCKNFKITLYMNVSNLHVYIPNGCYVIYLDEDFPTHTIASIIEIYLLGFGKELNIHTYGPEGMNHDS